MKISVVVPVYNGEAFVEELYQRTRDSLLKVADDYEIILVEDCGQDNAFEKIQSLAEKDSKVVGIRFSRNFGQHYGIAAGMDHSSGDWVVIMDCDLQDQPEEIINLYKKSQEGYDIVLAKRVNRQDSFLKRMSSTLFYFVFNFLTGVKYDKDTAGFCIMSRPVADSINQLRESYRYFPSLVQWVGFKTAKIEVQHRERKVGKSGYTFRKLLSLTFDAFISYSDRPIKILMLLGILIAFASFIFGIYTYFIAISRQVGVPGWASTIISVYFLSGLLMMNIGAVGLYVGRILTEQKRRPLYIIDKILNYNKP